MKLIYFLFLIYSTLLSHWEILLRKTSSKVWVTSKMDMLITVFLQFNFIILVLKHSTGADNVVWEYFYRPGNIAILGENFYTADKAISRLDCLSRCIRCPTVAFDDVSKECRHYNGQNHTIVPVLGPASGLGVWMSKQMTCKWFYSFFVWLFLETYTYMYFKTDSKIIF